MHKSIFNLILIMTINIDPVISVFFFVFFLFAGASMRAVVVDTATSQPLIHPLCWSISTQPTVTNPPPP